MARASCVYILRGKKSGRLLAAWTVRYEMVGYLNTCSSISRADQEQLFEVVRLPDGKPKTEFVIPWEEIDKV